MSHEPCPSRSTLLASLMSSACLVAGCGSGSGSSSEPEASSAAPSDAAAAGLSQDAEMATAQGLNRWFPRPTPTPAPSPTPSPSPSPSPAPTPSASDSASIAAATATATSATNDCSTVRPFYWEIGNAAGKLASGSVKSDASTLTIASSTPMSIASASKWIYGAYVAQKRNGALTTEDVTYLNFRSGYNSFGSCLQNQTVDACVAYETNGVYDAATAGKFDYGGGHMEKHASLMGLGAMNNATLATAIQGQIGSDIKIVYSQPQLAGGILASADTYTRFLRKVVGGELRIAALLGSNPVCTNPRTCSQAVFAPLPANESWHYSVGHWVEDDPVVGDGAFSSPGAFGFYPWIDATRSHYGVLARSVPGGAFDSVQCGRLIRKAWHDGITY